MGDESSPTKTREDFMFPVYYFEKMPEQLPDDDVCYIISKYIYLKKRSGLIDSLVRVDSINMGETFDEYAKMNLPKMKAAKFGGVLGFFREVYNKYYHSESGVILNLYTHPVKQNMKKIDYTVPLQKVSEGSCKYKIVIDPGYINCGTIHSHANFGAFHSSTDVNDEKYFDGLHITVGHVIARAVSISACVVVNSKRVRVDPRQYIEGITKVNDTTYVGDNEFYTIDNESLIVCNPKHIEKVTPLYPHHLHTGDTSDDYHKQIPLLWDEWFLPNKGEESKKITPCQACIFKENRVDMLHDEVDFDDETPDDDLLFTDDDRMFFEKTYLEGDSSPTFIPGEEDENGIVRRDNQITTTTFKEYKKANLKKSINCECGSTYFIDDPSRDTNCPSCDKEHEGQILTQDDIFKSHYEKHPVKNDGLF